MRFLELAKSRFSAKSFQDRDIDRIDLENILDAGRLAPSSYGLEPWKFVAFTDKEDIKKITSISFNQGNVATSSAVIVINAKVKLEEDFIKRQLSRFGLNDSTLQEYTSSILGRFNSDDDLFNYTSHQTYFATLQMALAAKDLGIDSCIIGGFERDKIDDLVNLEGFSSTLLIALGYSRPSSRGKFRLDPSEVIEIR